jgi:hypothetical protein
MREPLDEVFEGKGFDIKRVAWTRYFLDSCLYELPSTYLGRIIPSNADQQPNDEDNRDEDLVADLEGEHLFIYSFDSPLFGGFRVFSENSNFSDIVRLRGNFVEYVLYRGKKCSEDLKWSIAISAKSDRGRPPVLDKVLEKFGDNRIKEGWIKLSPNLKDQTVKIPFMPFSLDPFFAKLPVKEKITLKIKGEGFPDSSPTITFEPLTANAKDVKISEISRLDDKTLSCRLDLTHISKDEPANYRVRIIFDKIKGKPCVVLNKFPKSFSALGPIQIWWYDAPLRKGILVDIYVIFTARDRVYNYVFGSNKPKITQVKGTAVLKPIGDVRSGYPPLDPMEPIITPADRAAFVQAFNIIKRGTAVFRVEGDGKIGESPQIDIDY